MTWKTVNYYWRWQLQSSASELWPYVADTQRFNHATYLPAIDFTEIPLETGGSRRIGRTSKFGISVTYEDYPFEWIKEQTFSNLRVFEHGPLARTLATLTLEPNKAGTLLKYDVEVTPANLLGLLGTPYQFGWEMRRNFERVFRQIDEYLQNQFEQPFTLKRSGLNSSEQARLAKLTEQLTTQGYEPGWVQHLADLLTNEADMELVRMRPYVLADCWQALRRPILEMFLSAAKLGLLNMRWDLLCPLCRGAKFTATSLDEVRKGVHCPTCNIDYGVNFSENVELTFIPHPQIRAVDDFEYCIGGPMITPHIVLHQIIQPDETRTLQTKFGWGTYRLRTQRPGVEQWLELEPGDLSGPLAVSIRAEPEQIEAKIAGVEPGSASYPGISSHSDLTSDYPEVTLTMTNTASYPQRVFVERGDWYTNAVTAAQVTTLQHFRDLFSDEVLRPGEEIGIQGVIILFSDLVGSTAMYNQWGDAISYAVVRDQFAFLQRIIRQYDGAIVKTIGDAIMAAFSDPAQGVGAALAIQQEIGNFNSEHPETPLLIKLGLHQGPCIAVTLNGRLDYFGATVNLAARLEGQSQGGDVVISGQLREDPAVNSLLASLPVDVTPFDTTVKGFEDCFHLFRLKLSTL